MKYFDDSMNHNKNEEMCKLQPFYANDKQVSIICYGKFPSINHWLVLVVGLNGRVTWSDDKDSEIGWMCV